MNKENGYDYDSGWFTPHASLPKDEAYKRHQKIYMPKLIKKIKIYKKNLWRKWRERNNAQ